MILRFSVFVLIFGFGLAHGQLMSEYTQKTGRLSNLEKKVAAKKQEIKDHMKAISAAQTEDQKKLHYDNMLTLHKELKEAVTEYQSIRHDLKYKFPKKNDMTERRYLPLRKQTLEEIENETGMDSILTRVKRKIDKKYEEYTIDKKDPRAHVTGEEKKKKRIRLER